MANASYDTLTIQINADSKQANASISRLTTNLQKLDNTAKNINTRRIGEVKGLLLGIAKIDFSNVSKGLQDVVSAFKSFNNKSLFNNVNFNNIGDKFYQGMDFEKFKDFKPKISRTDLLDDIAEVKILNDETEKLTGTFEKLNDTQSSFNVDKVEQLKEALKEINLTSSQINTVFNAMGVNLKQLSETQISQVEQVLLSIGKSSEEVTEVIKALRDEMKKVSEEVNGVFGKIGKAFKNILKYRIIRKLIQSIYQGITTGIQRMAQFDKSFNNSMSQLKSSFEYLKSSIGSALAPIIKSLTPIITAIIDRIADLFNAIGLLFAKLRGDKTFAMATKTVEDYAEALKKTQSIGIDELNVINNENQKDYYINIDIDGVEGLEKLNESLKSIAEIVSLVAIALLVDWKKAFASIKTYIGSVGNLATAFKGLALSISGGVLAITSFIDVMTGKIDWRNVGNLIFGVTIAVIGLNTAFHNLNITMAGGVIGGLLLIISAIKDMTSEGMNFKNVILLIGGVLVTAVTLWKTVLKDFSMFLSGTFKSAILSVSSAFAVLTAGIMVFIASYNKVKESWGQMNVWQKLASVIGLVLIAVATLVAVISAFTHQWHIFAIAVAGIGAGAGITASGYATVENNGVQGYATGGFPEDGLFYANHNELVGKFSNGKTAVANNEQITRGIYEAVRDAMRDSERNQDINIEVDGYNLTKIVTKRQNNVSSLIKGGNLEYGK